MKYLNTSVCVFLIFLCSFSSAQSNKIDSLQNELDKSSADTSKANTLNSLAWEYRKVDAKKSLAFIKQALEHSQKINFEKGIGNSYSKYGDIYYFLGEYDTALDYYSKALTVREKINEQVGVAKCLQNIGDVYINIHDYKKGLDSYLKSLEIYQKLGEKKSFPLNNIALSYSYLGNYENAIKYYIKALETFEELEKKELMINPALGAGNVYLTMNNKKEALKYYKKALSISTDINSKQGLSKSLNNIGTVYQAFYINDTALMYFQKSLKIKEELGDKAGIALTLMNMGTIYLSSNEFDYALEYYKRALQKYEESDNKEGVANSFLNMGILYTKKNNESKAIENLKQGLLLATDIGAKETMTLANRELSEIYYKKGDFKNAYTYYKEYNLIKDSALNETNTKNIAEINTKYETEKKEKEIEILTKDNVIQEEKLKNETNVRNGFVLVSLLLLLLVFLAYNRYRIKQKANKEIAEKNKEITESISYAKRIQSSFLTSEKYIAQRLSDYFIFYAPRNIVSGDFYWLMEKDNSFYVCTADCTGHGIPGAFMSLISMGILNEIIYSKTHIQHTDDILNELRRIIILAVNPEGAIEEGKDGMDAVLCRYDFEKMELEYSAANNSFYIIREGEMQVFKPDKMPVGKHYGEEKPFTRNVVAIKKGDCVYTFSDGFADQFGGPEGKKFQTKRLKELLLSHCHKPMKVQMNIINKAINEWKGKEEQVDDILLIGIRV